MLVEPMAGDSLADNLNPVGRVYYAGSTAHLRADRRSTRRSALALGAQAGEKRIGDVVRAGRLLACPQGGGDAVQHGARSAGLRCNVIGAAPAVPITGHASYR